MLNGLIKIELLICYWNRWSESKSWLFGQASQNLNPRESPPKNAQIEYKPDNYTQTSSRQFFQCRYWWASPTHISRRQQATAVWKWCLTEWWQDFRQWFSPPSEPTSQQFAFKPWVELLRCEDDIMKWKWLDMKECNLNDELCWAHCRDRVCFNKFCCSECGQWVHFCYTIIIVPALDHPRPYLPSCRSRCQGMKVRYQCIRFGGLCLRWQSP